MIITIGLLVLLVMPTVVWVAVRYRPEGGARKGAEVTGSGIKHRWWQP